MCHLANKIRVDTQNTNKTNFDFNDENLKYSRMCQLQYSTFPNPSYGTHQKRDTIRILSNRCTVFRYYRIFNFRTLINTTLLNDMKSKPSQAKPSHPDPLHNLEGPFAGLSASEWMYFGNRGRNTWQMLVN